MGPIVCVGSTALYQYFSPLRVPDEDRICCSLWLVRHLPTESSPALRSLLSPNGSGLSCGCMARLRAWCHILFLHYCNYCHTLLLNNSMIPHICCILCPLQDAA